MSKILWKISLTTPMFLDVHNIIKLLILTSVVLAIAKEPYRSSVKRRQLPIVQNHSRIQKMTYNPFPVSCPVWKNMTSYDIRNNHLCIQRKWFEKKTAAKTGMAIRQNNNYRRKMINLADFKSKRYYNISHQYDGDCLYYTRMKRPHPGNCYKPYYLIKEHFIKQPEVHTETTTEPAIEVPKVATRTKGEKITQEIPKSLRIMWYNFFNEISGDLMYAFDFILWSEHDNIYNRFWFLMLYLKEMALAIENPYDLVSKSYHHSLMEKVDVEINSNRARMMYVKELETLEVSLKELEDKKQYHESTMRGLDNKLNQIIKTQPYEKAEQNMLLNKLNQLSAQCSQVGGMFNNTLFEGILK